MMYLYLDYKAINSTDVVVIRPQDILEKCIIIHVE